MSGHIPPYILNPDSLWYMAYSKLYSDFMQQWRVWHGVLSSLGPAALVLIKPPCRTIHCCITSQNTTIRFARSRVMKILLTIAYSTPVFDLNINCRGGEDTTHGRRSEKVQWPWFLTCSWPNWGDMVKVVNPNLTMTISKVTKFSRSKWSIQIWSCWFNVQMFRTMIQPIADVNLRIYIKTVIDPTPNTRCWYLRKPILKHPAGRKH